MEKGIAVSVIIPMYNVEKVIGGCFLSLSKQTIKTLELVFVDDCSTDGTFRMVSDWIKEHESSALICQLIKHSTNRGVAEARNTGLDNARGKYIYYVDSDDFIEPDTLQLLYEEAETNQLDIVGCEWLLSFSKNERRMVQPDVVTGEDAFKMMCKGCMRWNLWLFLVKRSLYEQHQFRFIPTMNMGEDMMVMLKLSLVAERVSIVHRAFYHYIQTNENSLTKNFQRTCAQITANVKEVELFVLQMHRSDLIDYVRLLQLTLKHPLLISSDRKDYELWNSWFKEANAYIEKNDSIAFYTLILQKAARAKQYWFLKLYYGLVIKVLYGLIYK